MSHDLRAPLRAITGYAQILKEDYAVALGGEGNRLVDVIQSSSQKMDQMINDLMSFSHAGRNEAVFTFMEMKPLVEHCIDELLSAEYKSKYTISVANLPGCTGDEGMLKLVWLNLLDNAIKYSSKKLQPVIEVGFEEDEAMNTYFVKDKGIGFDMQYSNKLFKPFQRLHRDDEYEGTGTGLAFVKRIILKHSGSVWVQSSPNEGSTFYFSIPKKIHVS
jgi:light-regulated signal transduction histidine kinase (bacteriophytochrome)